MSDSHLPALLVIFGVASITYSLRVSGLLFSHYLAKEGRVKVFLDYLPATLLLSLVVPDIIKEGVFGGIATLCIILCMKLTRSILFSMLVGIVVVAFSRNIGYF